MDMVPVTSSNIEKIGHDPASKTLGVLFKGGALWHYFNVAAEQHARLMNAESIGKHFGAHIRSKHEAKRVDGVKA